MTLSRRALLGALAAGGALTLQGCAALRSPQADALLRSRPVGVPVRLELADTPFFPQTEHHCGPAALATLLAASGVEVLPRDLTHQVYLPAREGSLQIEMMAAARRHDRLAVRLQPRLECVLLELGQGRPVAVLQNLGLSFAPLWHYAVVVGFDLDAGQLFMRSGVVRRESMSLNTFDHTWARGGRWACVVSDPPALPSQAGEAEVTEACLAFERVASPNRAATAYRSALQRWPSSLLLAMGLGNSLHAAGQTGEAALTFERAAVLHDSAAAWINFGELALDLGRTSDAANAARRAQTLGGPFMAQAADLRRRVEALAPVKGR